MVDIYEIAPHDRTTHGAAAAPFAHVGQEARMAQYQNLLSKLSQDELATEARIDWEVDEDENIELQRKVLPTRDDAAESLVGNFTDAAAAMR